jgi:hypothetical protein
VPRKDERTFHQRTLDLLNPAEQRARFDEGMRKNPKCRRENWEWHCDP